MNIVVPMKQIPDLQQIRIRKREPVLDDVPLTFGNIDKNALEAAVQIKEGLEGKVTVVCIGSEEIEDTVKEALAAGADEAHLVVYDGIQESSVSAFLLSRVISSMDGVDLIICGEGSGDNYSSQVGSRLAQLLDLPQVGYASSIKIQDDKVVVTRSLEDSTEVLELKLPAVIMVSSDINTSRIPSVSQILKAGKKPRQTIQAQELGVDLPDPLIQTLSNLAPEMERKQITLNDVAGLLQTMVREGFLGR